jgi:hypothetical protein
MKLQLPSAQVRACVLPPFRLHAMTSVVGSRNELRVSA